MESILLLKFTDVVVGTCQDCLLRVLKVLLDIFSHTQCWFRFIQISSVSCLSYLSYRLEGWKAFQSCLYQKLSQTLHIPERNRQGTLVGVIGILSGSISGPGIPFKTTSGSSRGMGVDWWCLSRTDFIEILCLLDFGFNEGYEVKWVLKI